MGRPLSLGALVAWQAATFLSGLVTGGTVFKGPPKAHWLEQVIKTAAQAAASDCARAVEDCCKEPEDSSEAQRKDPAGVPSSNLENFWGLVALVSFFNWLIGLVVAVWCCLVRKVAGAREVSSEASESPHSPIERRALAHQQLATLRLRRHGLGQ